MFGCTWKSAPKSVALNYKSKHLLHLTSFLQRNFLYPLNEYSFWRRKNPECLVASVRQCLVLQPWKEKEFLPTLFLQANVLYRLCGVLYWLWWYISRAAEVQRCQTEGRQVQRNKVKRTGVKVGEWLDFFRTYGVTMYKWIKSWEVTVQGYMWL
jgi:hypothetical protein